MNAKRATGEELWAFVTDRPDWMEFYARGDLEVIESSGEFARWRLRQAIEEVRAAIFRALPPEVRKLLTSKAD